MFSGMFSLPCSPLLSFVSEWFDFHRVRSAPRSHPRRPCPRRVRVWEPTASITLKLTYRGKQYELRHTGADSSLSLPLSLSRSFLSPFVSVLLPLLLSTALFSSLPILLSLSVLHLLSESLVLSVFTLSPCSPVSINPTCVCTSPGWSLCCRLHCLFYFKSIDRHTVRIKNLVFMHTMLRKSIWLSSTFAQDFPFFNATPLLFDC